MSPTSCNEHDMDGEKTLKKVITSKKNLGTCSHKTN